MTSPNNMNLETRTRAIEILKYILLQYKKFLKINKDVLNDSSINRSINPSMAEQLQGLWVLVYNNVEQNMWVFNTQTSNSTILDLRYEIRVQEEKIFRISQKIKERADRYYRTH
jgi:hypothetical protein